MTTQAAPHGFITRGIHWISAALIGFGYLKGLDSVSQLADPAVLRFEVLYTLAIGLIFAARFFWTKWIAGASRLPTDAPSWEHALSRAVHLGLYAGVFGVVFTGFGVALAYTLASGGVFLAAMLGLHEVALAALPALLVAHVTGAVWHKLVRQDGVWESMAGRLPHFARLARR